MVHFIWVDNRLLVILNSWILHCDETNMSEYGRFGSKDFFFNNQSFKLDF